MASVRPQRATIRDVARLSGVSAATVSRTFHGSPLVRPETSRRVREVADRLGYRPDSVAQALAVGTAQTVGVLVPTLAQPFWSQVAEEIEHHAAERGFSMVLSIARSGLEHEPPTLDVLAGKRLDGIIVGGIGGRLDVQPSARPHGPPMVLLEWDAIPRWGLLRELREAPLSSDLWRIAEERMPSGWIAHVSSDGIYDGT
ncbi:MAG TPA: LacI family DNA-binding transcriptional regulator, partial [Conexibacter sp.]|nr:LacI family DNA-binding transcriptional regulator [Conexibacter sp.]